MALSHDEFIVCFKEYMSYDVESSEAALLVRRLLENWPYFGLIVSKWNNIIFECIDNLADMTVEATWSSSHTRVDRLYEIGNIPLLQKVLYLYLRRTLHDPVKFVNDPSSLCKWVSYCLEMMCSYEGHIGVVRLYMLAGVRYLSGHCTNPEMSELVVILAILVKAWNVVNTILEGRDLSVAFCTRLLIWCMYNNTIPLNIGKYLNRKLYKMFEMHSLKNKGVPMFQEDGRFSEAFKEYGNMIILDLVGEESTENILKWGPGGEVINRLLVHAMYKRPPDWDAVQRLLPLSSNMSDALHVILVAAECRNLDVASSAYAYIARASYPVAIFSFFIRHILVNAHEHRTVENLLNSSACSGMATHWVFTLSEVEIPMFRQEPSDLTSLAVMLGLVSFRECFEHLRQFGSPGHSHRQQILKHMKELGTRPLRDVCRLTISHRIGFQPGRQERINALPLPVSLIEMVLHNW